MKRYSSLSFLVCLAVLNLGFGISVDKAIAIPANKQQYCIHKLSLPVEGHLYSQDASTRINVRQQPSIRSNIRYVGSSRHPVIIRQQLVQDDGYCWFRVQLDKANVTGWVRGDLLDIYLD